MGQINIAVGNINKNKSFFIVPAPSPSPRAKFFSERIWTNQEQEWRKSMSTWIKIIK
jgi:hypothetical protein